MLNLVLLLLPLARAADAEPRATATAAAAISISVGPGMVAAFTNTIVFEISKSSGGVDGETDVVVYTPTLLEILKAHETVEEMTSYMAPPTPTKALKTVVFQPAYMIGVTFGLLFMVGLFYTELCRRPGHVYRPIAETRKVVNLENDNSDKGSEMELEDIKSRKGKKDKKDKKGGKVNPRSERAHGIAASGRGAVNKGKKGKKGGKKGRA